VEAEGGDGRAMRPGRRLRTLQQDSASHRGGRHRVRAAAMADGGEDGRRRGRTAARADSGEGGRRQGGRR